MFGKRVFDSIYVHISSVFMLESSYQDYVSKVHSILPEEVKRRINVYKIALDGSFVSGLNYLDFFSEPFPKLQESWLVELSSETFNYRTYKDSHIPILHRKELLLPPDHPDQTKFKAITKSAESIGLFQEIGYENQWRELIHEMGYELQGNGFYLLEMIRERMHPKQWKI